MTRDSQILTPQTSLESVTSSLSDNNETMKSPWSRLRKRLDEVIGRVRVPCSQENFVSLLKLADEERSRSRLSSQVELNPIDNGVPSFWQETIHQLENRVQVLENALEISRDVIAKTEEKFDNLQRKVEILLRTQLQDRPLDADHRSDQDPYKAQMSLCFEQIRNQQYQLKHVVRTVEEAEASRNRRKCAGCGKRILIN